MVDNTIYEAKRVSAKYRIVHDTVEITIGNHVFYITCDASDKLINALIKLRDGENIPDY